MTVSHVDYNPVTDEFRDGLVDQGAFYQGMRGRIWGNGAFNAYRGQWPNVRDAVAAVDYEEPDVDQLAQTVVGAIVAEYQNRGLNIGVLAATLRQYAQAEIAGNLQADYQLAMDQGERQGFDQLAGIVDGGMSRAKGAPSQIAYDNLPGGLRGRVDTVLGEIRAENALWTVAGLDRPYTFPGNTDLRDEVNARQGNLSYQGNHTNQAGWLPAVATPVNRLPAIQQAIYNAASGELQKRLHDRPAIRLGLGVAHIGHPNRYRAEYDQLRGNELGDLGDAGLRLSVWGALAQGVSAYIEFNMPGGISRLLFDPVNLRVYVSAHYKWREGYNPFFQVTGYPAV